jgi:hypothetical protein
MPMASCPRYVGLTGVLFAIGLSGLTATQQQPMRGGVAIDVFSANSPATKGWSGDISFHWEGGSSQADHPDISYRPQDPEAVSVLSPPRKIARSAPRRCATWTPLYLGAFPQGGTTALVSRNEPQRGPVLHSSCARVISFARMRR